MPRRKRSAIAKIKTITKYQENCKSGTIKALLRRRKNSSLPVKPLIDMDEIKNMVKLDTYYAVNSQNTLKAVLIGLVKQDLPLTPCAHYYIGAAQVYNLLSCNLTPKFTHKFLATTKARHLGSAAEILVKRKIMTGRKKTFVSTKLPFLSGTPDFIINDTIIEIKSYTKTFTFTKEMLLQVLIYMEILQKSTAEIHVYCTLVHDEKCYDLKKTHIIGINKTTSLFTKNFIKYCCKGYIGYLIMLLAAQKIPMDDRTLIDAIPCLIEYCEKQPPGYSEISGMKISSVCRMMEGSVFRNNMRLRATKGVRWNHSDARLENIIERKESFTTTYESRERISMIKRPKGDMWSNYIISTLDSVPLETFHHNNGIKISEGRDAPTDVVVNEFFEHVIYKRAITISEDDIDLLYAYYTKVEDIGRNFHNFNYTNF